jgi:hypothetical protein
LINGKVPVYLGKEIKEKHLPNGGSIKICISYEETAILCDPKTLKHIGFID